MLVEDRKAFSLIELIFVIFITAILAIVAIPKLADLALDAKRTKIIAFVGTLNRTVGPSMWVKAILTDDGKVDSNGANLCVNIADYTALPNGVTAFSANCKITIDPDLGILGTNIFTDGTTEEAPKWELSF